MAVGPGRTDGWRLQPLGMVLVTVLILTVLLGVVTVIRRQQPQPAAPTPTVTPSTDGQSNRVFNSVDAIDHTKRTYDTYLAALAAEPESRRLHGPPYTVDIMLERLETIRPMLSSSLFGNLQSGYRRQASTGTITRDAVLCGPSTVLDGVNTVLRIGGTDVSVVSVGKVSARQFVGILYATVDLKSRVITEIACE